MVNLLKYEMIRKWRTFGIFLTIALGLNVAVLLRLKIGLTLAEFEQMLALSVFFGGMLMAFFLLFIIDVTVMYSQDLSRKTGYMLFLTPNSGYTLLGAKVLTGILEGILFLLVYLLLLCINFFGIYGAAFSEFLNSAMFAQAIEQIHLTGISLFPFITANLLTSFVSIVALVLTIFAAISMRKSILSEKRFGVIASFLFVLVLGWINGQLIDGVFSIVYKAGLLTQGIQGYGHLAVFNLTQIVFGVLMFFFSAYLLEKRIDL